MTTQVNDIFAVESKFYASLGNGAAALQYASEMIESVVTSRDTTVLTRAMDRASSKGDDKAVASLKMLVRNVWPTSKAIKNKKTGKTAIKIKGIDACQDAIETMKALVLDGVSLRGTLLVQAFNTDGSKPAFDVVKWATRMDKAHHEHLEAMIAALQAVR